MGNDVSTQAGMMAAKKKMSSALSSVEDQLTMKNKEDRRNEPKTRQKDWDRMHKETNEIHQAKSAIQKERVMTTKQKWEEARKKKAAGK